MEGKDAFASITNWGAIGGLVSSILISQGIMVDAATATAVISFIVTVYGRMRAGGIKSVATVAIPQPKE